MSFYTKADLAGRIIYLHDEIDHKITKGIIQKIDEINIMDVNVKDPAPIIISINSEGGDLLDGLSIVDSIQMSNTPIEVIARGKVYSAALPIFTSVPLDKRKATQNSTFIYHDASSGFWGKVSESEHNIEIVKSFRKSADNMLLASTTFTREYLDAIKDSLKDKLFTHDEVVDFKICTKFI